MLVGLRFKPYESHRVEVKLEFITVVVYNVTTSWIMAKPASVN
jgi:hypothetical protein